MNEDKESKEIEENLLGCVKDAGYQLQLEEGFCHLDQSTVAKMLGIKWYQSKKYEDAQESLDNCIKKEDLKPQIISLFNSLSIILNELLPLFLLFRVKELLDIPLIIPDSNILMKRLRHHYLIQMAYFQKIHSKTINSENHDIKNMAIHDSNKEKYEGIGKIWNNNLENGINIVLDRLSLSKRFTEPLLRDDDIKLSNIYYADDKEKETVRLLYKTIQMVRKDLDDDFVLYSKLVSPEVLDKFIPSKDKIATSIMGYLAEKDEFIEARIKNKRKKEQSEEKEDKKDDMFEKKVDKVLNSM